MATTTGGHRGRRPAGRAGGYLHARRCLQCGADMTAYRPVRAAAAEAAEVVARIAARERRLVTSDDVAPSLGPASRPLAPHQAAEHLTHAWEDGLVSRQKLALPGGGYRYLYAPKVEYAAYATTRHLAAEVLELFGVALPDLAAPLERMAVVLRPASPVAALTAPLHVQHPV